MLRSQPFWWGASLALVPGLFGMTAVWYAGTAIVNSLWHLLVGHDSPEPLAFAIALLYGLMFGPLLQCFFLGTIAHIAWHRGLHRVIPWLADASWSAKTGLWLAAEAIYFISFVWAILSSLAYALAALLSSLIHPSL